LLDFNKSKAMIDESFFKKSSPLRLEEICNILKLPVPAGADGNQLFDNVANLREAGPSHIACYNNKKYQEDLINTKAGLVFAEDGKHVPEGVICLVTPNPYFCFGKITSVFYPETYECQGISPHALISSSAKIGKNVEIGPFTVIEDNVTVGDGCIIRANCVIRKNTKIGNNCCIESNVTVSYAIIGDGVILKEGCRIGNRGFGFHMDERGHFDVPQLGRVIIGNNVIIGSNTTIDRGSFSDTVIGNGVRICNLVQIAHNVEVGDHSVLVAQVGIAGSSKLGKFVIAAGQVGIAGHLNIGNGVRIAAKSGVMRDIEDKAVIAGIPAMPAHDWHRQTAILKQLVKKKN